MPLFIVGLGLGSPEDVTLRGLKLIRSCEKVFLESYTSVLPHTDEASMRKAWDLRDDVEFTYADREMVESNSDAYLTPASSSNVCFLVVGDPFGATTHSDLYLRAIEKNVKVEIVHNASIMNAIGCTGLQLYKFGETISIPRFEPNWRPSSYFEKLQKNLTNKLHTLCLLDIKVKEPNVEHLVKTGKVKYDEPYFMSVSEGVTQLLELARSEENSSFTEDSLVVGVARVGCVDQKIVCAPAGVMKTLDLGPPLHSFVVVGEADEIENEMLSLFSPA